MLKTAGDVDTRAVPLAVDSGSGCSRPLGHHGNLTAAD